jgi:hypothetical protein
MKVQHFICLNISGRSNIFVSNFHAAFRKYAELKFQYQTTLKLMLHSFKIMKYMYSEAHVSYFIIFIKEVGPKMVPYDICTFYSFSIFPTKMVSSLRACDICHRTSFYIERCVFNVPNLSCTIFPCMYSNETTLWLPSEFNTWQA